MTAYSPGTSPVRYSGISDLANSPSGKKILRSGPYHLASSSSAGDTATALDLGAAAFFFEKRATVLKVVGLDGDGAGLDAPPRLSLFPSISETPMEDAREAILRGFALLQWGSVNTD